MANVFYVPFVGIWVCAFMVAIGLMLCVTIIGIPLGIACMALGVKMLTLKKKTTIVIETRNL